MTVLIFFMTTLFSQAADLNQANKAYQQQDYEKALELYKQIEKKEVSAEDKAKSEELKTSAIANARKYLEVNPQAEDKEDVEELIKDLTEPEKEEQPKVLKG